MRAFVLYIVPGIVLFVLGLVLATIVGKEFMGGVAIGLSLTCGAVWYIMRDE